MKLYECLSLIITGISVIVSILMWIITYNTLKEVRKQNMNICNSLKSDTVNKIHASHQNIFSLILNNRELVQLFNDLNNTNDIKTKENIIATLLFNHTRTMFSFYEKGFLDKDDWTGMQNDIKDFIMKLPFVKSRWDEVKSFYTEEYQDFIDKLINKGRYYYKD